MKKKRFVALLGLTFLIGSMIIYYIIWLKSSYTLAKGEMTQELAKEYDHCKKIIENISQKVAMPDEVMTPNRKATSCSILLGFTMTKYKQIKVYGVVDQSQQRIMADIIQQNVGRSLPVELVIYESENLKQVGAGYRRQKENEIYERWFETE
jgi:hypothetical protein